MREAWCDAGRGMRGPPHPVRRNHVAGEPHSEHFGTPSAARAVRLCVRVLAGGDRLVRRLSEPRPLSDAAQTCGRRRPRAQEPQASLNVPGALANGVTYPSGYESGADDDVEPPEPVRKVIVASDERRGWPGVWEGVDGRVQRRSRVGVVIRPLVMRTRGRCVVATSQTNARPGWRSTRGALRLAAVRGRGYAYAPFLT